MAQAVSVARRRARRPRLRHVRPIRVPVAGWLARIPEHRPDGMEDGVHIEHPYEPGLTVCGGRPQGGWERVDDPATCDGCRRTAIEKGWM